jgi:uncharacterized protein (DUF2235 family)
MPKNIVICCDGTANEFAVSRTNVIKLYSVLVQDPSRQVSFYHPGIGTMEPAGALSPFARKFTRLLGMAVGFGLENDIRDAYAFLMQSYDPGDCIFLFGFSRGAFTVRAMASLIQMYAMIRKGNEPLIPYAIRMLMGIQRAEKDPQAKAAYFDLARDFKRTMSSPGPTIRFVGVWDTVSSVGWIDNPLHLPYEANNPSIEIGRHAVSIDEHRAFFRSHLWQRPVDPAKPHGPVNLEQVWFPGVHCDVGGGYCEAESALSKYPLEWMIEEAKAAGLLVDQAREDEVLGRSGGGSYCAADSNGCIHDSLTGAWHFAEFVPKRYWDSRSQGWTHGLNLYRRRTIPPGSLVHDSAFLRGEEYAARIPPTAVRVTTKRNQPSVPGAC